MRMALDIDFFLCYIQDRAKFGCVKFTSGDRNPALEPMDFAEELEGIELHNASDS